MTLSELIINYRSDHGLSQRQMASLCNLSTGYISLIEKEVNPQTWKTMVPTLSVLNKLACGMGVTLDYLLSVCDDIPVDISYSANLQDRELSLTPHERDLVLAYRSKPAMQAAVDTLLGLASSSSPSGSGYICKSNDEDGKTVSSIIADDVIETIKEKTSAAKTGSSK